MGKRTKAVSGGRPGIRLSLGARFALALVVISIAAFLSWSAGTQLDTGTGSWIGPNNAKRLETWYATNLPYWTSAPFTDLNDLPRLTKTVSGLIEGRFPGPPFDQEQLVRDLTVFLHALGAQGGAEYLNRISGLRRLRAEIYGERFLQSIYRSFSGEPLPPSMNASDLLDLFWKGDSSATAHPKELARVATIQVGQSKKLSSEQNPRHLLENRIMPDFSMWRSEETDAWIGPVALGLPQITRPQIELEDVIAKHTTTLMCNLYCALRNADGEVIPVWILLFYSPDEETWQVESFGSYYRARLFWPY